MGSIPTASTMSKMDPFRALDNKVSKLRRDEKWFSPRGKVVVGLDVIAVSVVTLLSSPAVAIIVSSHSPAVKAIVALPSITLAGCVGGFYWGSRAFLHEIVDEEVEALEESRGRLKP